MKILNPESGPDLKFELWFKILTWDLKFDLDL